MKGNKTPVDRLTGDVEGWHNNNSKAIDAIPL